MSAEAFRQTIKEPSDRVIVALDNMDWEQAAIVMEEVYASVGLAKANSIAQKQGWEHTVHTIGLHGLRTMADAKYKDVPSTVENHVREATECTPRLITIFADNTLEAVRAAVNGRQAGIENLRKRPTAYSTEPAPIEWLNGIGGLLGVTVLTSIGEEECVSIYGDMPQKKVMQFAHTAREAGLDGIVCSGEELEAIRSDESLDDLLTVVPGITPPWAKKAGDQKRIVTPTEAVQRGADYIVVGRAITKPPEGFSRHEAAQRIAEELKEAL